MDSLVSKRLTIEVQTSSNYAIVTQTANKRFHRNIPPLNSELSLSVCHSLRTQKSPLRHGVRLHLPRKLHAPAHGTLFYGNRQQPVSGAAHCRRVGDAALRPERLHKAGNAAPVQTGRDVVLVTPTYAWRSGRKAATPTLRQCAAPDTGCCRFP